ncbi:MAG: chorismate synthase [Gemmatimonadota bacterium]|nr:chorismate synthase [Gemmatimonadota bacterium]
MIRFTTAGESHGRALVAVLEGVPAGLAVAAEDIDRELRRRMMGHGRGARMKIEADRVELVSGVRAGETIGSPIAMLIPNRDWSNWADVMAPEPDAPSAPPRRRQVHRPRPGHVDLVGVLKYGRTDARDVLERASARETAARVACGAVGKLLLGAFGVEIGSHVVAIGGVEAPVPATLPRPLNAAADASPVRCLADEATRDMVVAIDAAKRARDTLGGVVEIVAFGLPVGLGSHVSWDRKLDGRLAGALMSIPAVKGVEIGLGFAAARHPGSEVHDAIRRGPAKEAGGFGRDTNRAGGTEAGITTGEPLAIRVAMKPIATLMRPLETVDLVTGKTSKAQAERSDVTAVPALGVIGEAMVALVLADALVEKFGGDSLAELRANVTQYLDGLARRFTAESGAEE